MTTALAQTPETFPPHIDLRWYFDIIDERVRRLAASLLVEMNPTEADHILASAFENDPTVCEIASVVRGPLVGRAGAVRVIVGDPFCNPATLRVRQLVVGFSLGNNANHYSEQQRHRALFEITPQLSIRYGGNGENASTIGPHTDGSGVPSLIDILGLLCINPASSAGGETLVYDALRAVLSLPSHYQAMLAQPWPRTNPYDPNTLPIDFVRRPIAIVRDPFEFSYHPQRIRQALDRCGESTPERMEVLSGLDYALSRHCTPLKLQTGELLLLNNRKAGHGRIGFVHDEQNPRRLERQWIKWRIGEFAGSPLLRIR